MNDPKEILWDCRMFALMLEDTLGKMPAQCRDVVLQNCVTNGAFNALLPALPDKLKTVRANSPLQGKVVCAEQVIVEATVTGLTEQEVRDYFEKCYGGYIPLAIARIERYKSVDVLTHLNLIFGCCPQPWCTIALISISEAFKGKQLFPLGLLSSTEKQDLGLSGGNPFRS
jgi:hypothetical protein